MQKWKLILCAAAVALGSFAAATRNWEHSTQADFEKGKRTRLSLRSDGRLSLAPVFRELFDASTSYLWAVAEDSKGRIYLGGGGMDASTSKLFVVQNGNGRLLGELPGLGIHAIAIDNRDRVYAATSPDGKVYRLAADGKPETFYDPKVKYIWSLAVDSAGNLFVGTGEKGEIHKVTPAGAGSVFFKTEESHVRTLAAGPAGNLFAGTEPGGLILRIGAGGDGFVLHQSSKREVTSLTVDSKGQVYAVAVGNKTAPAAPPPAPVIPVPQPSPTPGAASAQAAQPAQAQRPPAPPSSVGAAITGGSEVVRIEADGYARRLWTHASEIAYAIVLDSHGRPVIGTGNRGTIYRLDSDLLHSVLVSAAPTQVTGLAAGSGGRIHAVTGNIGKLYQLGPELEKTGEYEGDVLDAGFFSHWGRLRWMGSDSSGKVTLAARSGNLDLPQQNWSPWTDAADGRIASPAARFLQYKVTLTASSAGQSPEVSLIEAAYLPKNVAPVLELVSVTPPNFRFPPQPLTLTPNTNLTLPPLARAPKQPSPSISTDVSTNTMISAKGHIGARWLAKDENNDFLLSKVEIRGVKETEWKLLKDKLREKYISWDSTAFPDGEYRLRITVNDSPDNPAGSSLESSLESDVFVIDNTPPQITALTASRNSASVEARWRAADSLNRISKAEYSLDGGDWMVVLPTTRLSDSRAHDYVLKLDGLAPGEHTIAVRVTDEYDNQAVDKALVR
ncbi:MAG: hypothetical protein FJW20_18060 [Acidimicrobiia bacterium]|nr:hypothetical protein [Acidimicrobiia bacterium]